MAAHATTSTSAPLTGPVAARSLPRPGDHDGRCTCGGPCHGLKEWSTTVELCAWLGLEETQLYWMTARGNGPRPHRIGRGNLYRRGEVERWLLTRLADG